MFLELCSGVKGFKLWDLEDKKIIVSREMTFIEIMFLPEIPMEEGWKRQPSMFNKNTNMVCRFESSEGVELSDVSNGGDLEVNFAI